MERSPGLGNVPGVVELVAASFSLPQTGHGLGGSLAVVSSHISPFISFLLYKRFALHVENSSKAYL
jgi:hypothetical protein